MKVIRAPIIQMKILKSRKLGYILHYLSFMISSLIYGLLNTDSTYDYIIVSSPPLFIGVSGLILSKVKRAKYILDVRDIWPDSAVSTGQLSDDGFLYKFSKKLEKFLSSGPSDGLLSSYSCVYVMKNYLKRARCYNA